MSVHCKYVNGSIMCFVLLHTAACDAVYLRSTRLLLTVSICALVVVRIEFCDIYEQKLFSSMFRDQESLKNP